MTLPKEIQKIIDARELELTEKMPLTNDHQTGYYQGFSKGYQSGATEWAGKAQPIIDISKEIVILFDPARRHVLIPSDIILRLSTALAKYKEVSNG
jgi:hypothetical protein